MNDAGGVLLSVRAEARQLVAPDYAVLGGLIGHTARSKAEAVQSVSASLESLTADLAARGGAPFDESTGRSPLTWSAHSAATREDSYHDKATGQLKRPGTVTATVSLRITIRDLHTLDDLTGLLAAHPSLHVQTVSWEVDWDNPAWPQVRAAAITAAIGKARDYAAALGVTVQHVEHVADTGLLGGDSRQYQFARAGSNPARAVGTGLGQPGTPALNPVPQELIATIEARFRTTDVTLPGR